MKITTKTKKLTSGVKSLRISKLWPEGTVGQQKIRPKNLLVHIKSCVKWRVIALARNWTRLKVKEKGKFSKFEYIYYRDICTRRNSGPAKQEIYQGERHAQDSGEEDQPVTIGRQIHVGQPAQDRKQEQVFCRQFNHVTENER